MNSDSNISESQANLNINSNSKSEYYKKWYAENKANKLAYQKEKIKCEDCDVMISRVSMPDHKRSATHLKNVEKANKYNNNKLFEKLDELDSKFNEIKELLKKEQDGMV